MTLKKDPLYDLKLLDYRMENEKYRYYEPSGVAEDFINAFGSNDYFILFLSAANGVGKTALAANIIANICYPHNNPWFRGGLFDNWEYLKKGRIITESDLVEKNVVNELKTWLPKDRYVTKKAGKHYDSRFFTDTGFDWDIMTYDQDPMQFEGVTLGWAWFDEPPPDVLLKATISRMRKGGIIIITATPISGSAHLYDMFANGQIETTVQLREGEEPVTVKRRVFHLTADVESVCFTKDVEVLTKRGWVAFNKTKGTDKFASVDPFHKTFSYQEATRFIHKKTTALVDIKGITCTPDHLFPAIRDDKRLHIVEAQQLYRGNRLLNSAKLELVGADYSPLSEVKPLAWARFIGWYLAEGSYAGAKTGVKVGKYQVYVSQKTKRKQLRKDLQATGLDWKERANGDFWLSHKRLHSIVSEYSSAKQKKLPRYVFDATVKYQREVLTGLILGDGDCRENGRWRYRTTSSQLADDVQQLGVQLGMATYISKTEVKERFIRGRKLPASIMYTVYLRENASNTYIARKPEVFTVPKTDVYCVSVPNENLIVRDKINKRPLIAGNCKEHGIRGHLEHKHIEQMVAEYPEDERQARVYGKFQHLIGLVYKKWNRDVHVIEPFALDPREWCVYHSLDPHPRNPDAGLWIAVNSKGTKIVVDEYYENPDTVQDMAYDLKKKHSIYRMERPFTGDPSMFVEDQHTQRCLATMLQAEDLVYIEASKARAAADKRIETALDYREVNGQIIKPPELYVFSNCKRFIYEVEHWRWQEWKGKTGFDKNRKEQKIDKDDHTIECAGRILIQEPQFRPYIKQQYHSAIQTMSSDDPYAS